MANTCELVDVLHEFDLNANEHSFTLDAADHGYWGMLMTSFNGESYVTTEKLCPLDGQEHYSEVTENDAAPSINVVGTLNGQSKSVVRVHHHAAAAPAAAAAAAAASSASATTVRRR
jgi:hypothetical protein